MCVLKCMFNTKLSSMRCIGILMGNRKDEGKEEREKDGEDLKYGAVFTHLVM